VVSRVSRGAELVAEGIKAALDADGMVTAASAALLVDGTPGGRAAATAAGEGSLTVPNATAGVDVELGMMGGVKREAAWMAVVARTAAVWVA